MALFNRKKAAAPAHDLIDLREPPKPKWGSPMPCPHCSGRGYLDHIDPYRDIMFLHCTECFAKYEVARSDLAFDEADVHSA